MILTKDTRCKAFLVYSLMDLMSREPDFSMDIWYETYMQTIGIVAFGSVEDIKELFSKGNNIVEILNMIDELYYNFIKTIENRFQDIEI